MAVPYHAVQFLEFLSVSIIYGPHFHEICLRVANLPLAWQPYVPVLSVHSLVVLATPVFLACYGICFKCFKIVFISIICVAHCISCSGCKICRSGFWSSFPFFPCLSRTHMHTHPPTEAHPEPSPSFICLSSLSLCLLIPYVCFYHSSRKET